MRYFFSFLFFYVLSRHNRLSVSVYLSVCRCVCVDQVHWLDLCQCHTEALKIIQIVLLKTRMRCSETIGDPSQCCCSTVRRQSPGRPLCPPLCVCLLNHMALVFICCLFVIEDSLLKLHEIRSLIGFVLMIILCQPQIHYTRGGQHPCSFVYSMSIPISFKNVKTILPGIHTKIALQ